MDSIDNSSEYRPIQVKMNGIQTFTLLYKLYTTSVHSVLEL